MNVIGRVRASLIGAVLLVSGRIAIADFVIFTEKAEWEAAVGPFDTITFTEYPSGTLITDQYLDSLGVEFTDGYDFINFVPTGYEDDFGLRGAGDIEISFSTPQSWFAVDYPGLMRITLFSGGEEVFSTGNRLNGGGVGFFGGVVSDMVFDSVVLHDFLDGFVYADNIHFGAAIPSPAGATLVLMGLAIGARRRRRRSP